MFIGIEAREEEMRKRRRMRREYGRVWGCGNKKKDEGDEDNTNDEDEEDDCKNNDENEEEILEDSINNPKPVVSKTKKIKNISKPKNRKKKAEVCNLTGIDEDIEDDVREKKLQEILTVFRIREEEFFEDDWWSIGTGDGWLYEEDNADVTHGKRRKGTGKGSSLLFLKEKWIRTFSQSSVPGKRDVLSKLFSSLSFSKLASHFASQNSMAMDLMQKRPALTLIVPFNYVLISLLM
ncbi:uncharacterized protein MONOS_4012 [Monocercomonoides exilis]|uniref:uncharacterized protein n=1 Tax=Monocercomonoides exilis TaxID=2049356 RepID=UPI003559FD20|nr:hypothetical protein MONOS_4012 [Monocercomonoides exilis]|eukprot:MONOS_4012.1-p1 / transcript=MONOS_4012.1 / gene=MONOS_4012 / organism=Monocercomonoides_exilis_PA203 / gene_product=unspecified product / transcript_product=unspecified product / location=Mono_scaffold00101:43049-43756(-) / protein_length=236 / sequence_SO=supercontig / SO=protein_coding / is_pseudo=false